MAASEYHRVLFDALCRQDMNGLAKAAYEILRMPVEVTDAAFIVRAKYPDEALGDEQWDAGMVNRQMEPRFLETFSEDDHFARHDQARATIITDWGHYEKTPRLTSVIKSDGVVLGYFAALATGVEVEPWHFEAADAVRDAFGVLMAAGSSEKFARSSLASPVLYALLDGPMGEPVNARTLSPSFVEQNQPPYKIYCICSSNPHDAPLEMYLVNQLAQYFEHSVQTACDGKLYVFASGFTEEKKDSVRNRLFAEEIHRRSLYCGVSRTFTRIEEIRKRSWEASSALCVATNLGAVGSPLAFEDNVVDIVCDVLAREIPDDALEHPALAKLARRDSQGGTNYLETLSTYYQMGFNKKRTCEKLHIHRNTLQYRLDRIFEILGSDGGDFGLLCGLYFAFAGYRKRAAEAEGDVAK